MKNTLISWLLCCIVLAAGSPGKPTVSTLWTFPNHTWIENLQVLGNGSLLISTISHPYIWMLDPGTVGSNGNSPQIAYTFQNQTSTLGMAEIAPNVVAVASGQLDSATLKAAVGSWTVSILDFSPLQLSGPKLLATHAIPGAGFLNGMTTLPNAPGYLLLADSDVGCVWRLNLYTGTADSYTDELFLKAPNTSSSALNGIQVAQGRSAALENYAESVWSNQTTKSGGSTYLYFTNSNTDVLGRIAITREGLPLTNVTQAEKLANAPNKTSYDDFAISPDGSFVLIADWIGTSVLSYQVETGKQTVAAGQFGDVQSLDHPTSVRWANNDLSAIYVSTAGWFTSFGGSGGGQVLKVTTRR